MVVKIDCGLIILSYNSEKKIVLGIINLHRMYILVLYSCYIILDPEKSKKSVGFKVTYVFF